jgi:hypothetical protein
MPPSPTRFFSLIPLAWLVACGGTQPSGVAPGGADAATASTTRDAASSDGPATNFTFSPKAVSVALEPAQASIDLIDGAGASQQFQLAAKYSDGSSEPVQATVWISDSPQVGSIGGDGVYSARGSLGGVVKITATYQGLSATGQLTAKLHLHQNTDSVPAAVVASLQGASAADAQVAWAYPYDGTIFPRGVREAPLMWLNGSSTDVIGVHVTSATFELEAYAAAPQSRYNFDATAWQQFIDSTTGTAEVKVTRWDGQSPTVVTDQHWSVAPATMRGSIYYWGMNAGRVLRISADSDQPDDFLGADTACHSCHTVSANGQRLVMNEGTWPQETSYSYDLKANTTTYSGLSSDDAGASEWGMAGISAAGTVLVENFAPLRGPIGQRTGAFDAVTGEPISGTGLEGKELWMPAFAPDDQLIAYVDSTSKDLRAYDWDSTARTATGDRLIVAAGSDPNTNVISLPTVSPDHQWIVYQRSSALGSLGNPGDLYAASVAHPGTEVSLDALNGATYPFAAGDRDRHLNYEPTFAPVAAGGYFWLVLHSRRTWGNALTGPAFVAEASGTKQLWAAAFDQSPVANQDPSHAAFHVPGQDPTDLNMRGYWALDPCKDDGTGCLSGTECCGGYCAADSDAGATCTAQGQSCAQNGDRCMQSSDCCEAADGVTCINRVCSEPPPPR